VSVRHAVLFSLPASHLPDARGAKRPVLAGVELDEVAGRETRPTASAGELPLAGDDVGLETDELPAGRPDDAVLACDDAAQLRRIEYLPGHRRVPGERLDAVHGLLERQFVVFEVCQQLDAEFDRPRERVVAAGVVVVHARLNGARPQSVWRSARVFPTMKRATVRQVVGVGGLVGLAAAAALVFSPETVVAELEALAEEPLLFAVALVAVYLVRPFLLWPVSSIALVLGYLYGPAVGLPLALAGAALTGLPPYCIGRYAKTDIGLFGYISNSGEGFVDTVGETRGMIAARLSPVPGDPISYGAGLSGVSLRPFLAGTVVGEIPWALVTVFTGASMRTLSLSEFAVSPELVVALAGLALIVLAGPLYNRTTASVES